MSNGDTYYYIKNAANPESQCMVAGDQFDGKTYLVPHQTRANAKWKFEPAGQGFYYIIDNRHGCALGTGLAGPNDPAIHHCDKRQTDWAQYCQWRVQRGKEPGTYILIDRFFCLGIYPAAGLPTSQVHLPRLSQLQSQWVLETAIEGENKPEFMVTPEPFLDTSFLKNVLQGAHGIDVNAPSPRLDLTAPETERHRFAEKTPWLKQVTRDRSIASVYQKILRNPGLRYEASGSVIENVVVENDSPDGVVATPPAHVDENHEYRFFFAYVPSKNAVARLPYALMGTTSISTLLALDSPQSSAVKIAAVGPGMCYVLHGKDRASPAQLCLADFMTNLVTSIQLPGQYALNSCEICYIPQERKLLLAVYAGNRCVFRRHAHGSQAWETEAAIQVSEDVTIKAVALSESGAYYLLDSRGNLRRTDADNKTYDLGQPSGLLKLEVTSDGGVWGFFGETGPGQRICVLYENASGKASWQPVLEPTADRSKTPNGYNDKDKDNSQGIACAPISSTQALCWPLAPSKAKRRLYRLAVGAVDQPPLQFPTYTDEAEKRAYKAITDQLLESSGHDLRSRYVRISPAEANNYLTQLQRLTPNPADQISPEKFRAVRDDLACELTYLVFAKNLFDELHLHVLTSQMVNDHAMAAVAKAFDVPTDVRVKAGSDNPETSLYGLEIAETTFGGTSAIVGTVSAGLGAAAVTTASLAGAAAVTGVGAAIVGIVAIALAVAAKIVADQEEKASKPEFEVSVNDSHYVINSTLAGIQQRVDQIFVGMLDQLEAWKRWVSQDLGALIVVGRLAKAQVWSTEDLPRVDDPKQSEIERATRTVPSIKAYYEACVRTYAKALLRHFMMVAVQGAKDPFQMFSPLPTTIYPRWPFHGLWSWEYNDGADKSSVGPMHMAWMSWECFTGRGYLMQKGAYRDPGAQSWEDLGAPVGTDLVKFLIAHGATTDDIANNWDLIINDGMCQDWGHR
jgi:hypothetical protein